MKKADSQLWWILGTALIVVVVVILILMFFKGASEHGFGDLKGRITALGDCDGDKTSDAFDACVCDVGENNGCPQVEAEQLKMMQDKKKSECTCKV